MPLLIRGPASSAGSEAEDPVVNADLAPTLLAAAGVEPQLEQDGLSLLGPLAGDPAPDRDVLLESRVYAGGPPGRYVWSSNSAAAIASSTTSGPTPTSSRTSPPIPPARG